MVVIRARNVHTALPIGIWMLKKDGVIRGSRNGKVLVMPEPVTTVYAEPTERVIFWEERNANPFFHLYEAMWMLAGQQRVDQLTPFVARMKEYSDDGEILYGAYGRRWFHFFNIDQVHTIIAILQRNPDNRQCVLQMWSVTVDLGINAKDIPCNTHAYFSINHEGALDMTVCCRSNDIIWGAYGANAVHFSVLQEYMAFALEVPVGRYWQVSNNYHAYVEAFDALAHMADMVEHHIDGLHIKDPYFKSVKPCPLITTDIKLWRDELLMFFEEGMVMGYQEPFFRNIFFPMMTAHKEYKEGRLASAQLQMGQCEASDWRKAGSEWLERIEARRRARGQKEPGPG